MNANELADSIKRFVFEIKETNNESDDVVVKGLPNWFIEDLENSATMLRTQQAEIEALKKDNQQLDTIARKSLQNYKDHIAKELTADVLWMLAAKHLDVHDTWREGKVTEGIGSFIEAILKAQEDGRKLATPSPVKNDVLFTEYNEAVSRELWLDSRKDSEK